jgi:hypothetical protein
MKAMADEISKEWFRLFVAVPVPVARHSPVAIFPFGANLNAFETI